MARKRGQGATVRLTGSGVLILVALLISGPVSAGQPVLAQVLHHGYRTPDLFGGAAVETLRPPRCDGLLEVIRDSRRWGEAHHTAPHYRRFHPCALLAFARLSAPFEKNPFDDRYGFMFDVSQRLDLRFSPAWRGGPEQAADHAALAPRIVGKVADPSLPWKDAPFFETWDDGFFIAFRKAGLVERYRRVRFLGLADWTGDGVADLLVDWTEHETDQAEPIRQIVLISVEGDAGQLRSVNYFDWFATEPARVGKALRGQGDADDFVRETGKPDFSDAFRRASMPRSQGDLDYLSKAYGMTGAELKGLTPPDCSDLLPLLDDLDRFQEAQEDFGRFRPRSRFHPCALAAFRELARPFASDPFSPVRPMADIWAGLDLRTAPMVPARAYSEAPDPVYLADHVARVPGENDRVWMLDPERFELTYILTDRDFEEDDGRPVWYRAAHYYGRADWTGDGVADLLVMWTEQARQGTYAIEEPVLITSPAPGAPLEAVRYDTWMVRQRDQVRAVLQALPAH